MPYSSFNHIFSQKKSVWPFINLNNILIRQVPSLMKKNWLCLGIIAILLSGSVVAEPLSLVELVDIALENNPETEKAWANTKQAQAILGIAKSANYPTLDAKASVNHGREVKYPNGPDTVFTFGSAELFLNYLLYDFGERKATIQAMKEALLAARWGADFTMQQVIYKVSSSYYEYLYAQEVLQVQLASLQDMQTIFESAEDLYKAGLRCATDLHTSKAEVAQQQMDLAQQRAQVAIAYGKLLTNLGLPIQTTLEIQTNPEGREYPHFEEGIAQLLTLAEEQRADLMAKKAKLAEMRYLVKKANRAPWPKLRGEGQGGWLEYTKHQGNGYNYNTGISLDIPLFKGFEYTYNKHLALANEQLTVAELKELHDAIAFEVLSYSESVKASKEALKWSGSFMEESLQSYEGSLESYKAGLQNIFDLIQAQRSLAEARMKKAQARTQWLVSLAELAFATGTTTSKY